MIEKIKLLDIVTQAAIVSHIQEVSLSERGPSVAVTVPGDTFLLCVAAHAARQRVGV